jgi:hypothetical protein
LAAGIHLTNHQDLNYSVRPREELADLQRQVYRTYFGEKVRHLGPRSRVSTAQSDTATGFYYASSAFLESQSHRFIFGSDGAVSYHRDPYDVHAKKIPSEILELHGVEEIAQNEEALAELLWLDQKLADVRPEDWRVVITVPTASCEPAISEGLRSSQS